MAWIESHQRLKTDPKLKRFCRALEVSRPTGIGMLHELWWFALDHVETGDLSKVDPQDLAQELDWPEDKASKLWDALTATGPDGEPGFVEAAGQIHAWDDYSGRLMRDRQRKRAERANYKGKRAVRGQSLDSPRLSTLDRTVHNPTQPTNGVVSAGEGFESFWKAYPKHQAKADALKAWKALKPDQTLLPRILEALDGHRRSPAWTQESGKFVPLPATWIRGRRWEDELKTAASAGNGQGGSYESIVEH